VADPIEDFTEEARRFCDLVEKDDESNSWVFAEKCLIGVLRLFERALLLPSVQPDTTDARDRVETESQRAILRGIVGKLAHDHYWVVFEPLEPDQPEPVAGLISDDLADIWRDNKEGLLELNSESKNDALWHWRISFETHWAQHVYDDRLEGRITPDQYDRKAADLKNQAAGTMRQMDQIRRTILKPATCQHGELRTAFESPFENLRVSNRLSGNAEWILSRGMARLRFGSPSWTTFDLNQH